jgi:hypothetical protein
MLATLFHAWYTAEVLSGIGITYLISRAPGSDRYNLGRNLTIASLALQLGIITLFFFLAGFFHYCCITVADRGNPGIPLRLRRVLYTLYVSMGLTLVRTIYRSVEHFGPAHAPSLEDPNDLMGLNYPVLRQEWFFYVFEASPMLFNAVLWNLSHPRRHLPQSYKTYLAQDGETGISGPGWPDKRNMIMTVADPCGLLLMCEPGNKGEKFWEENGYHHLLRSRKQRERPYM